MGRTEVKEAAASHEGKAWRLATAGGDNHVRVSVTLATCPAREAEGLSGLACYSLPCACAFYIRSTWTFAS